MSQPDASMGSWLMQLGCVLYMLVLVRIVWLMPSSLCLWGSVSKQEHAFATELHRLQ